MSGIVGNTDTWTVTFVDANGVATAPDGDVTWTVTVGSTATVTTQTLAEAVSTGVYQLGYTPTVPRGYRVKASSVIGGEAQATDETFRAVSR